MAGISAERMAIIKDYTGACNAMAGESYVSAEGAPFAPEDVAALQDAYFNGGGERMIHMSDVPGWICWKSMGPVENRKFADRVDGLFSDHCEDAVLAGEGGKAKCDALAETADAHAESSWWSNFTMGAGGLAGVWAVFGPGMSLWHKIAGVFARPVIPMFLILPAPMLEQMADPQQKGVPSA